MLATVLATPLAVVLTTKFTTVLTTELTTVLATGLDEHLAGRTKPAALTGQSWPASTYVCVRGKLIMKFYGYLRIIGIVAS